MNSTKQEPSDRHLTRREAIQRAALLLGLAISPSIVTGVMQAQTPATATPGKPRYLTARDYAVAAAAAERIIPRTDTPGARDVGVPDFIDLMWGEYLTWEEKQKFTAGLSELFGAAMNTHGKFYEQLPPEHQDRILREVGEDSRLDERSFFHLIKELTVVGYFSSEPVGKKVLRYDPIPGPYRGCVPLSEVGNVTWTPLR
jgi:gluconate 2-dehydrogenase gamma chain